MKKIIIINMFIVIEGTDSSGKATQTKLLIEKLEKIGKKVKKLDFPAYNTAFGEMVARYLRGEFGTIDELEVEVPALLYAIDRYQFKNEMFADLKKGNILIANRYLQSNIGFQGAKFESNEKKEFINWIKKVEGRLPQANLIIFLDMPTEAALSLLENREDKDYLKGKKKDIHEENKTYQEKVRETYLEEGAKENWLIIKCADRVNGNWKIKTKEDIHSEIWEKVKNLI